MSPDEDEEEGEEGDEGREDVDGGEGGVEVEDNEGESIWWVASTVDLALTTISGTDVADAVDGAAEAGDGELWSPDVLPAVADLFAFRPARSDERKASKGAAGDGEEDSTVAALVDIFLVGRLGGKICGVEKRKAGVPGPRRQVLGRFFVDERKGEDLLSFV